jgi:hypothetical protein
MKTKENKNNKIMNDYQIALSKMPDKFTSHDYLAVLRTRALPKSVIQKASHKNFLAKECEQLTKKTWRKTGLVETNDSITVTVETNKPTQARTTSGTITRDHESMENRINQAIQLLKDNGYKVYRVVEELV